MPHFNPSMENHIDVNTKLWYGIVAIGVVSLAHYAITSALFKSAERNNSSKNLPPVIPYFLPFLGSIPWQFIWDPIKLFTSSYYATITHPFRIRLLTKEFYIIQGQEHVVSHLAQTTTSNIIFNASFLRHACAMSEHGVQRFGSNDEVTPKHFERKYLNASPLYTWSSSSIHRFLIGRSALQLSRRFESSLADRIQNHRAFSSSLPGGVVLDDFMTFFAHDVNAALIDAMCGTHLIQRNSGFLAAFAIFCDNFPVFMKRTPRFLARRAYEARDRALDAVVDWQTWARETFDADRTPMTEDGDDAVWGSQFFRERYAVLRDEMGFSGRDVAAVEMGFLFGASANATLNTFWCAVEVFKDKALLEAIRTEVAACKTASTDDNDNDGPRFDTNKLVQQPLLQAVFAENLRLRCHNMFIRKTTEPIDIVDWRIPKDQFVVAWSTPGQMNPSIWHNNNNTNKNNTTNATNPSHSRPLHTFSPARFLHHPTTSTSTITTASDNRPAQTFSLEGKEGAWLPFGSGAVICPGRQFAKVHAVVTLAMMVDAFDCDVLAAPADLGLDRGKFGMGVLGPRGRVGVRMRRRGRGT